MSKTQSVHKVPAIRVLLANHDSLVSAGVRCLLEQMRDIEVVGEASLSAKTLGLLSTLKPHLLFLCLGKSIYEGVLFAQKATKKAPSVGMVVLSSNTNLESLRQLLDVGAKAILCHTSSVKELEQAVRTAAAGDIYLSKAIPADVVDASRKPSRQRTSLEDLTLRQKTILKLIAEGRNTKEIADRLKVSSKTVEFHRARLMERLSIHELAGLIRYALRTGLVEL